MDAISTLFVLLAGILIRLALPIGLTLILIQFLRKLDIHWQSEAEPPIPMEKPKCWKIKKCPPENVANCIAACSSFPCWQVYRKPDGYLREECLTCEVFVDAPLPALSVESRRM